MNKINNKMVRGMAGLLLCLPMLAYAAEKDDSKFPIGCDPVGYKNQLKMLTLLPGAAAERNSMYFVYNRFPESVNLYHTHNDQNYYNVYLNHTISSKRWAVFSTNEKAVNFICTVKDRRLDYGRIIDCKDALAVCEYTKVKFGMNNRGNLWIVNSNTRNGAIREVVRYGIIPAY